MGFRVPDISSENVTGGFIDEQKMLEGQSEPLVGVDTGVNMSSRETTPGDSQIDIGEEAADVEDTIYPTRMSGIMDNTQSEEEALETLKNLNKYDEMMDEVGENYNQFTSNLTDSTALKESWQLYQDQAVEVHKKFLGEQLGKDTAKLFGQSFVEHLENQRDKYEALCRKVEDEEQRREYTKITDNALKRLVSCSDMPAKLGPYTEKAFEQACEEAELTGIEGKEEITKYAQKRMLGAFESIVDRYVASGQYEEAAEYLKSNEGMIAQEDKNIFGDALFENGVVSRIEEFYKAGDSKKCEEVMIQLPASMRNMAEVALKNIIKKDDEAQSEKEQRVKEEVIRQFKESGKIRPYVRIDGVLHQVEPADYADMTMSAEDNQVNQREQTSQMNQGDYNEQGNQESQKVNSNYV